MAATSCLQLAASLLWDTAIRMSICQHRPRVGYRTCSVDQIESTTVAKMERRPDLGWGVFAFIHSGIQRKPDAVVDSRLERTVEVYAY